MPCRVAWLSGALPAAPSVRSFIQQGLKTAPGSVGCIWPQNESTDGPPLGEFQHDRVRRGPMGHAVLRGIPGVERGAHEDSVSRQGRGRPAGGALVAWPPSPGLFFP